jgi:CarD family transcriptional regulator
MSKKTVQRHGFRTGESIVYPAHGVGKIIDIEEQVVAGMKLELFVINFQKDKMTLRVPVAKAAAVGMRKLADEPTVAKAFTTVRGRARVKRTMWSRRAQEYEAKINSGDLIAISEVVRDLYRSQAQPEPSYSERQLYEQAIDRMSREVAVVEKITEAEAVTKIEKAIEASPRRKRAAEAAEDESKAAA